MKKSELITAIANDTELHGKAVESVLDSLSRITSKRLGEGDEITIPGIAKLGTKVRAARTGRNPQTGAPLDIPAKTVVDVKVLKGLADHVA